MFRKYKPAELDNLRAHPHRHWWSMVALFGVMISGISIDLNVPSLPAIAHYFDVEKGLVQLTITAYLFGMGFSQLLAGVVSDSVGRKRPFIIAIVFYIICSLLSPLSQNIYQLIALRFFQGMAVSVCSVSMRAIIPDLFEGTAFKKMASYMSIAWSIGPIVAPAIGGYLQAYFGWQGPFYFLAGYAASLLLLMVLFVPETLHRTSIFKLSHVIRNTKCMLSNKGYVLCMIYAGLLYSMLVLFGVACPFLIQNVLGYSAIDFGHIALLMGFAWLLGNSSSRLMLELSPHIKITVCFWLMFVTAAGMLICSFYVETNIYNIVIPIFFLIYLAAIIFPNYYAKAMTLFPEMSASANALMGSSFVICAGLVTILVSVFKMATQIPLSLIYMGLVSICMSIYYMTGKAKILEA
ncbi:MAG: bcr 1 [Gammaproteobacteria bacterium]|nr:bcr 1 [Gammaproteobacteria bacterium]